MSKSEGITNIEQGILNFDKKGITNKEQGMSNIEVLACVN